MDKPGAGTISLIGAASMSQEELDFLGDIMTDALQQMTVAQKRQLDSFKPRA